IREVGINVLDNDLVYQNGAWSIFQTELVLSVFGMVPAVLFVVTAIARDIERNTQELFFTTPVSRTSFLFGRLAAGTLAALCVGAAGLLGAIIGTLLPGLDPLRLAPFNWQAWLACLG